MRHVCEYCQNWTPFVPSWYDPEREVADALTLKEWDAEIFELLSDGWTVEDGCFIYYWAPAKPLRKRGHPMRYLVATLLSRHDGRIEWDPRDKPWGSGLQRKLLEWLV